MSYELYLLNFVAVVSIIGFIVEWDSHKWFSRDRNLNIRNDVIDGNSFAKVVYFSKEIFSKGQFVKINTRSKQYFS